MAKFTRSSEGRYFWGFALLVLSGVVGWTQLVQPALHERREALKPPFTMRGGAMEFESHDSFVAEVKKRKPRLLLAGDSLTYAWGNDRDEKPFFTFYGLKGWRQELAPLGAVNVGFPGADTRSLQWRLENGLLKTRPDVVMLLIGINEISDGIAAPRVAGNVLSVVEAIHIHSPKSRILLLGILPAGFKPDSPYRPAVSEANRLIAEGAASKSYVRYMDIGARFMETDGNISPEVIYDGVHLTSKGYGIWLEAVLPTLKEMLAQPSS